MAIKELRVSVADARCVGDVIDDRHQSQFPDAVVKGAFTMARELRDGGKLRLGE